MMRYVTKFQPLVTTVIILYSLMKVNTCITLHFLMSSVVAKRNNKSFSEFISVVYCSVEL